MLFLIRLFRRSVEPAKNFHSPHDRSFAEDGRLIRWYRRYLCLIVSPSRSWPNRNCVPHQKPSGMHIAQS
jgi:hypothetical protein